MMTESKISAEMRLEATRLGARLFRNHVGQGWQGDVVRHDPQSGTVTLRSARRVSFGFGVGSSDLIGWVPVLITPEHVGTVLSRFLAVEVKAESGKASTEQDKFIATVVESGGVAGVLRSAESLALLLCENIYSENPE